MTCDAYLQPLRECPIGHYAREGFQWLNEHPWTIPKAARGQVWAGGNCSFDAFNAWRDQDFVVSVIEYVILSIEPAAKERLEKLLSARPKQTLFD